MGSAITRTPGVPSTPYMGKTLNYSDVSDAYFRCMSILGHGVSILGHYEFAQGRQPGVIIVYDSTIDLLLTRDESSSL